MTFLIDTGLLFEFFERVRHPSFPPSRSPFFSLLVIVFASLYSIIDRIQPMPFRV
jgi:hypothetical protein